MPILLLPDLVAIVFLTLVVAVVRRQVRYDAAGLWTVGLLLIVLECVARVLYLMTLPRLWHDAMHAVALDAYCLAGVVFLRSASPYARQMRYGAVYMAINTLPHLLMMTLYGLEFRSAEVYRVLAIVGLSVGLSSAVLFQRSWRHLLVLSMIWTPLIVATTRANFRIAIYLSLFFLYLLIAAAFAVNLKRKSKGRLLIATGFLFWSLCFVTHPWVAGWGKLWVQLSGEVWDMQKFLITLGFVLLLFEHQVWNAEWMALHDGLTGLPNRRLYADRLAQALARAERSGATLMVFNLDLDGFKTVNDTMGHEAGDALLRQVGLNLQACVRRSDTLARLGGDEFSLLAVDMASEGGDGAGPATLQARAERLADNLRRAAELPVPLEGLHGRRMVEVSTSIGVALYPADGTDAMDLCRTADRRMYEDKQGRRWRQKASQDRMAALSPERHTAATAPVSA